MSLVGAAIVPHSPLLLPSVAKEHAALGDTLRQAVVRVGNLLYAAKVTDLVVLTPHGATLPQQAAVLAGEELRGSLRDFGDLDSFRCPPSPGLAQRLAQEMSDQGVPTIIQSSAELDYGTIVPLRLFGWPSWPQVIPVAVGHLSSDQLIRLGRAVGEVAKKTVSRVAVVASSDFSRRRGSGEQHDRPTPLERQVARALRSRRTADLPALSRQSPCGLYPLVALLSTLEGGHGELEELLTNAPYGVGEITAWLSV